MKKYIVFDAETIIHPNAPEIIRAKSLKVQPKPGEDLEVTQQNEANRLYELAPLNWQHCQVVLIGLGNEEEFMSIHDGDEGYIVNEFLQILSGALKDHLIIGHNIKGFDLPMIINRARCNKIKVPPNIYQIWKGRPYFHENIIDTLDVVGLGRNSDGNSVENVAQAYGLKINKTGHGANFGELWAKSKAEGIAYNKRDVQVEMEIAHRCGLIELGF